MRRYEKEDGDAQALRLKEVPPPDAAGQPVPKGLTRQVLEQGRDVQKLKQKVELQGRAALIIDGAKNNAALQQTEELAKKNEQLEKELKAEKERREMLEQKQERLEREQKAQAEMLKVLLGQIGKSDSDKKP